MIDDILTEIGDLKWIIVIYSAIIILLSGLVWFFTRKFSFDKRKILLFASLYNLEYNQILSLGLIIGRLVFTLCSTIFCKKTNIGYLIVFVIFSVLISIFSKDYYSMPSEILNSAAVFALLFIQNALYIYYIEYEHSFTVLLMIILLGMFSFLYMVQHSITSYSRFLEKKKEKNFKLFKLKAKND